MEKKASVQSNQTDPAVIEELFDSLRRGSKQAAGQLVAIFYSELRRMARLRMRSERAPHTWQPTVLVNELYLELLKIKALDTFPERVSHREAFFGLAAHMMKRMLVHHARPLYRRAEAAELSEELKLESTAAADLAEVENLLDRLGAIDPQLRTIVELCVFEGCSIQEIASHLNCTTRTLDRRWSFARKWLEHQLSAGLPDTRPQKSSEACRESISASRPLSQANSSGTQATTSGLLVSAPQPRARPSATLLFAFSAEKLASPVVN